MKTVFKTIGILFLIAVAIETVALILKTISHEQFMELLKKTALIAIVVLVLGIVLKQFMK